LNPDDFKEFKSNNSEFDLIKIVERNSNNLAIHALSINLGINWNVIVPNDQLKSCKIKGGIQSYDEDNSSDCPPDDSHNTSQPAIAQKFKITTNQQSENLIANDNEYASSENYDTNVKE
jgi:hypothetical protein